MTYSECTRFLDNRAVQEPPLPIGAGDTPMGQRDGIKKAARRHPFHRAAMVPIVPLVPGHVTLHKRHGRLMFSSRLNDWP